MAVTLFDAVGFLGVDDAGLRKGMKGAEKFVGRSAGNIVGIFGGMATKAALALAGLGAATAGGFAFVAKMGMDAVESENLFVESMGSMEQAARSWSEELSDALNVNSFALRKNIGTFNVMLTSMGVAEERAYDMSKSLTQLSMDMASFYNLDHEEAFQKLQSGISGEIEPLKRLGIVVNETIIKHKALEVGINRSWKEVTEAEKVWLRYLVIMDQTDKAQGDMLRTLDSGANLWRQLTSVITESMQTLGMFIQPVSDALLNMFLDLFVIGSDYIKSNEARIKQWAESVSAWVDGVAERVKGLFQEWTETEWHKNEIGRWEETESKIDEVWRTAKEFFASFRAGVRSIGDSALWSLVKDTLRWFGDWFPMFGKGMLHGLESIARFLKGDFSGAWEAAKEAVRGFKDAAMSYLRPVLNIIDRIGEAIGYGRSGRVSLGPVFPGESMGINTQHTPRINNSSTTINVNAANMDAKTMEQAARRAVIDAQRYNQLTPGAIAVTP